MKIIKYDEGFSQWWAYFIGQRVNCQNCKARLEFTESDLDERFRIESSCGPKVAWTCPVCGHKQSTSGLDLKP